MTGYHAGVRATSAVEPRAAVLVATFRERRGILLARRTMRSLRWTMLSARRRVSAARGRVSKPDRTQTRPTRPCGRASPKDDTVIGVVGTHAEIGEVIAKAIPRLASTTVAPFDLE